QSIPPSHAAAMRRSAGHLLPAACFAARYRPIPFDSQSTSPSSSIVGTRPLGLRLRYRGVFTTPNGPPASIRLYPSDNSSQHQSTFCTLSELLLPQIVSMVEPAM